MIRNATRYLFAPLFAPKSSGNFGNKQMEPMKKVTYKTLYNHKKRLDKAGKAPLYIRITIERKAQYFNTGLYVEPEYWSEKKGEIKTSLPNGAEYKQAVQAIQQKITAKEIELRREGKEITFEALRKATELQKEPAVMSFTDFYANQLQQRRNITPQTKTTQGRTLKVLTDFKSRISFKQLNYTLIQEFENYLIEKNLKPNTRNKFHRHLRTYVNEAINQGLMSPHENPYTKFRSPKADTHRKTLNLTEIALLETLTFEPAEVSLEVVRDAFVFCCYCGLRFKRLSREHLTTSDKGEMKVNIEMQKTSRRRKRVDLPLHQLFEGKPKRILERYLKPETDKEPFFPLPCNPIANRYLKDIAGLAGIKKPLTFHVSRHSFGTNVAEVIDVTLVQKLMGHSKLETTMNYINHNPERTSRLLQNTGWKKHA
jgi:site-specific recombinase XerD